MHNGRQKNSEAPKHLRIFFDLTYNIEKGTARFAVHFNAMVRFFPIVVFHQGLLSLFLYFVLNENILWNRILVNSVVKI